VWAGSAQCLSGGRACDLTEYLLSDIRYSSQSMLYYGAQYASQSMLYYGAQYAALFVADRNVAGVWDATTNSLSPHLSKSSFPSCLGAQSKV
jgi:hypothetical protein